MPFLLVVPANPFFCAVFFGVPTNAPVCGVNLSVRAKTLHRITPHIVEIEVEINVGKNIEDASALPAVARIAITVAGIS